MVDRSLEGTEKLGVIRLAFEDFRVRTGTTELVVQRIYDGLDLSPGELGNGWRYEWSMGHVEVPEEMHLGWTVRYISWPPSFEVTPDYDHPVNLALPDGRNIQFLVLLDLDPGLSSIHPARPEFLELSTTGSTIRALDERFNPYSTTEYDLYVISDVVYENLDFDIWEPRYWEVTTDWDEVFTFDARTGEAVRIRGSDGVEITRTGTGLSLGATEILRFTRDAAGRITRAMDTVADVSVEYRYDALGDLVGVTAIDGSAHSATSWASRPSTAASRPSCTPRARASSRTRPRA
jgi:hypothetical protein